MPQQGARARRRGRGRARGRKETQWTPAPLSPLQPAQPGETAATLSARPSSAVVPRAATAAAAAGAKGDSGGGGGGGSAAEAPPSLLSLPAEALGIVLAQLPLRDLCRLAATCSALRRLAWPQVALALPLPCPACAAARERAAACTLAAGNGIAMAAVSAWLRHRPRMIRFRMSPPQCGRHAAAAAAAADATDAAAAVTATAPPAATAARAVSVCGEAEAEPALPEPRCWAALVSQAAPQPQLHSLSLYGLQADAHLAVCRALARCPLSQLRHLDLGGRRSQPPSRRPCGPGSAEPVGDGGRVAAAGAGHLEHVQDTVVLARALTRCPMLESVSLDGCALARWADLRALFAACGALPHLRLLQLGDNRIGDAQLAAALDGLAPPPALAVLELRRNALGARAARALCPYLSSAPALEELDLTANVAVDDAALAALFPLLSRQSVELETSESVPTRAGLSCRGLQRILLRRCPYTIQGACAAL